MRPYRLPDLHVEIDRGTVLLDTNVLVAYHSPRDKAHRAAVGYLSTIPAAAVTDAVLAESWGMLTKDENLGYTMAERRYHRQQMLEWVADPGNGILVVPDAPGALQPIAEICSSRSIDVVDVLVADLAHRLGRENAGFPLFPVASLDGDFYRLLDFYTFKVVDPRSP